MALVAVALPGGDFLAQSLLVRDAAIQALRRQDPKFGFSRIQPTAVFWGVVPLEPFKEAVGFGGGKGLLE